MLEKDILKKKTWKRMALMKIDDFCYKIYTDSSISYYNWLFVS